MSADKKKSRSVSRGKRASIFGQLLEKKEAKSDKVEDKSEAESEAAAAPALNAVAGSGVDEPIITGMFCPFVSSKPNSLLTLLSCRAHRSHQRGWQSRESSCGR